ncbi:MAG TPA: hypothetical protein VHO25_22780 [Polyangiaceae bacterium]|nr:hypothetical protein [Polyangiaceae bacterium]
MSDISFSYDDWFGPRTNVTLGNLVTHLGEFSDDEVMLSLAGGPKPNGHRRSISEMPRFQHSTRYLVFLVRGEWKLTPVRETLTVIPANKVEFLASNSGMAVSSFNDETGFHYGGQRLFSVSRDWMKAFDPPVRSQLLQAFGDTLASQITTKQLVLEGLRVAAAKYKVAFEPFVPMPQQELPWDQTQVGGSAQ